MRKYRKVAAVLMDEIANGIWPVGFKLPTEALLCERFQLSRSTVRQALAELEEVGVIERRQGSGATVIVAHPPVRYALAIDSDTEILDYAAETVLELSKPRAVDAVDARRLQLGDARNWRMLRGIRRRGKGTTPLSLSSVFVQRAYEGAVVQANGIPGKAIFETITQRFGLTLNSIEQMISATLIESDEAATLQADVGSPALVITRRFATLEAGLIEVAESVHPADRFSYQLRLDREGGGLHPLSQAQAPHKVL